MLEPVVLHDGLTAAGIIHVKPETLPAWRHRGEGPPYIKVGSLVRYPDDLLRAWLASRTHTPGAA